MRTGVSRSVRELLTDKLALEVASDDADLLMDGTLDSVTLVQLILHLEQTFDVRIELAELEIDDLRTVRAIASLVERLRSREADDDLLLAHATSNIH